MLAQGNKTEKAVGKRIQFKIKMGVGYRQMVLENLQREKSVTF